MFNDVKSNFYKIVFTFLNKKSIFNLDFLYKRETTYHTFLELLMVTFETYERILRRIPAFLI